MTGAGRAPAGTASPDRRGEEGDGTGPGSTVEDTGGPARARGTDGARGPWSRHSSETVHTNPWYSVRRDSVTRPDGVAGDYFVVVSSPAVFVVALDGDGRVALVDLHRYTVDRPSLEVPAGSVDEGEAPEAAARRELAEEAGLTAASWRHLALLHPANGLLAEDNHVFLATGLGDAGGHEQEAEGITGVRFVDLGAALRMARDGGITDGQTVAALALAAVDLGLLAGPGAPVGGRP